MNPWLQFLYNNDALPLQMTKQNLKIVKLTIGD